MGPPVAASSAADPAVPPAEPGPPPTRWPFRWIAVALAVTAFGAGLPTPIYSLYESEFHFSTAVLGVVFGAYTAGVFATLFFLAPVSDVVGRKPILYAGMALTAVSGLVFLFAGGVLALVVARVISGLGVGATTSTATAAMAGLEPRGDQHHVARVAVAANFGAGAVGILLSGLLVEYGPAPTRLVFVVMIGAAALGCALAARTPETVVAPVQLRHLRPVRIRVPTNIRGPFWVSVGAIAACYSIYGLFGSLAPSYVRVDLAVQNYALAAAFVASMFGMAAIVQLGLGEVRDRRALLIGLPVVIVGLIGFVLSGPLASVPLLVVGAGVLGTGVGFAYMGSVTLIDRISPAGSRSEILSGFYLAGYLALAVPTIGVAAVAGRVGLASAGLAFGVVLASVVVALYLVLRRTPTPAGGEGRARGTR